MSVNQHMLVRGQVHHHYAVIHLTTCVKAVAAARKVSKYICKQISQYLRKKESISSRVYTTWGYDIYLLYKMSQKQLCRSKV